MWLVLSIRLLRSGGYLTWISITPLTCSLPEKPWLRNETIQSEQGVDRNAGVGAVHAFLVGGLGRDRLHQPDLFECLFDPVRRVVGPTQVEAIAQVGVHAAVQQDGALKDGGHAPAQSQGHGVRRLGGSREP